ncbi:hypothetical protein P4O66_012704 [Electrophorus voltai]|uniref:Tc1-like transposase DDE domain-containing protein n=1 Tax=Electrophorus voltai TaxID=2609070 RepID=A0AAD9DSW9_9TELE|nr:hypothetical protein P4O66_012704 [Electrophorus voltai]
MILSSLEGFRFGSPAVHVSVVSCMEILSGAEINVNWKSPGLNPVENFWDVREKTLRSDPNLPSSIQDLREKFMQLWTEINVDIAEVCGNDATANACRNQS